MPHGELKNELTLDEVPQGLIDELNEHFNSVTLALDTDIDTNTTTLKAGFTNNPNPELVKRPTLLPETFEMVLAEGYERDAYMVRLNKTNDNDVIVKRVLTRKYFELVNVIGSMEEKQDGSVK